MFSEDWVWLGSSFSGYGTQRKVGFYVDQQNSPCWLLGIVGFLTKSHISDPFQEEANRGCCSLYIDL